MAIYYFDIDFQDGTPRTTIEYNVNTHEQAKKLFRSQFHFDPCKTGAGRALGMRVDSYGWEAGSAPQPVQESNNNSSSSSSSSSSDNGAGAAMAGAVIGGTFGLVGSGLGWIGSNIKDGIDEAQEEEDYARECGGQVWEDYQAQQKKEQDQALALIGKTVKWGSVVAVSIATLALWEITLPLAIVGGGGYLLHKKNVNKNRPSSVQSQYRKEVL